MTRSRHWSPPSGWGLHLKAHRGVAALIALALLHLVAFTGSRAQLPLMTLDGVLETPLVTLLGLMIAPVIVWALGERTRLERVSTRPLHTLGQCTAWVAALVPALVTAAVGTTIHARAVLASLGLTMLVWQWRHSMLAALPAVGWFVLSVALARLVPGIAWWGCFVYTGDLRTWVAPVAVAVLAWMVTALGAVRDPSGLLPQREQTGSR